MAYRPSAGRNQAASSAPKVPNLIPIMNLFLTIIPFLILMMVISQVALVAFNFSNGAAGGEGSAGGGLANRELQEVTVIIMATEDSTRTTFPGFEVRVNPASPNASPDSIGLFVVTANNGTQNAFYDYRRLDQTLKSIKLEHPDLQDITVAAYDNVLYETLMKTIDICKSNQFPNVQYKSPQTRYFGVENKS
jgi:hypothetical protein